MKAKYNPRRWSKRVGPFRVNFSNLRFTSWGIKFWIFSWNSKKKKAVRVDTFGPGSTTFSGDDR
jgi:hypothetical protein